MTEISGYFEAIKDRYALTSDYTLAEKLGIAQPDANLMRRGLKVPKPELCIKIAKLLDRNPVELLLIAQKDKAQMCIRDSTGITGQERCRICAGDISSPRGQRQDDA